MKVYEFLGKNVEQAKENGLKELGLTLDEVDIKVLDLGGLFRKAKIQIVVDEPEEETPVEVVEEPKVEEEKVEETVETPVEEKPVEPVVEEVKPVEVKVHISEYEDGHDVHEEEAKEEVKKEREPRVYENNKGTKEFLDGLLKVLNIEGETLIEELDEHTKAMIKTEQAGALIGHKGDTLSAIQYLANVVEQKNNRNAKRVIVDIADYRERRDDGLKDLADRMARKCLKLRKAVKLNPMNAYDRRIVHTYLQDFDGVVTHSEGVEPRRCLIIEPKRD